MGLINIRKIAIFASVISGMLFSGGQAYSASRIKDIADFEGVRENQLVGYGLVVGLNGTGDNIKSITFTKESLISMLDRVGINSRDGQLKSKNVAAVMVTGNLPAFGREGSRIDVMVSALGDAKSLQGGTLIATPLVGADGEVYAVAQGQIAIGGFSAVGNNQSVTKGVPTSGRIPNGAIIENEVNFELDSMSTVQLALRNPDFTTSKRVAAAINALLGETAAKALDPSTVSVQVPEEYKNNMVDLMTKIEQLPVQPDLAAKELRADLDAMNEKQREAALFIAKQYNMHALAISISNLIKDNEREIYYDGIAYPDPDWKPKNGWQVDRALVWALVRQESGFNAKAQSGAGAKGLMQLLSSTAAYVTKDKRLRRDSTPLFETEYNLETGQRYVNYLMEKDFIGNNLFFLTTAYNAGPGNLYKWQKRVKYGNDPLMFIEAIPSRQTRIYIERVLANFWMYNARFGQPSESLEELVHGEWPKL